MECSRVRVGAQQQILEMAFEAPSASTSATVVMDHYGGNGVIMNRLKHTVVCVLIGYTLLGTALLESEGWFPFLCLLILFHLSALLQIVPTTRSIRYFLGIIYAKQPEFDTAHTGQRGRRIALKVFLWLLCALVSGPLCVIVDILSGDMLWLPVYVVFIGGFWGAAIESILGRSGPRL